MTVNPWSNRRRTPRAHPAPRTPPHPPANISFISRLTSRLTSRRELAVALACCAVGAAAVLLAGVRPWVRAVAVAGALQTPVEASGSALAPAVPALALAGLTGALAIVATRGLGRRLAGVILLLCGAGICAGAATTVADTPGAIAGTAGRALGTRTATVTDVSVTVWPWVALLGASALAVAGAAAVVRGARWPGMSGRYDAPRAARTSDVPPAPPAGPAAPAAPAASPSPAVPATDPERRLADPADLWQALDRGEDPT